MSEQSDLNQAIVGEGRTEQEAATPENGIVKSESLDEEEKLELQRRLEAQNQERRKSKSGAGKGKLTRSLAVCEESSARPGGESLQDQESIHLQLSSFPSLQEDDKSRKDDSEREKEKDKNKDKTSEKPKIRMLSKDCSQEYTDSTGIDLHEFLINTLKNNSRDRMILLKMEQEIIDFIADNNNHYKKFPQMSSYQRMLVHRVAAYFGLDHNVDQTGKSVIINKTSSTRIPEQRFSEHLKDEKGEESQKRFILKRDNSSIDKEDNQSVCALSCLVVVSRGNRDGSGKTSGSRQSSSENELKWSDHQRAWSSTDSDSSNRNLKPAMTKTASFGGISVLTRGDSTSSTRSTGKLSKAGSESSSSTGSSGSLSRTHPPLQSAPLVSGVPASSSGCVPYPENGMGGQVAPSSTSYILLPLEAATGIPPGSILLNPHTARIISEVFLYPEIFREFKMPVYYYPSGQYPTSNTQQYRPMASVQYSAPRSQQMPQAAQQAGYQPVLSGQQGFQGLIGVQQVPQSQNMLSNQQGTPVQSVMVSYPTLSSYQVPMTQGSQGLPQQSYQQPIMLPTQAGQGSLPATAVPVYCNVTPPTPQNNLRLIGPHCPSSTVPVMSASCRANCASMSNAGWQVKF
ncbi:cAMP-regulated phosphoprotein 21 [Trichechus manatus latirostris]|uniref:cAMP-regulated phosphoprotein 21 n=1 Tax=Trichechus manatus latirostris TaxID=127582 RepID=A0A2Y9R8P6_TRIMA|nr:cAMP-regulated phosphoprotein 21 [Trichechus manatus latirostris]